MDNRIYTFDDQSKKDALDLLKEETSKEKDERKEKHGKDCHCTWCDPEKKQKWMELLAPEISKKVDPEVYVFADQTREEVKQLLQKSEKIKPAEKIKRKFWSCSQDSLLNNEMFKAMDEAEKKYPTPKGEPCLAFDKDVGSWETCETQPEIRETQNFTFEAEKYDSEDLQVLAGIKDSDEVCSLGPLWRKLSGVRPGERVYEDNTDSIIMERILNELQEMFPDINIGWSEERCYNQNLVINGAKTKLRTEPILKAFEAIKEISDHSSAEDTIVSIITKKVGSLFI